MFPTPVLPLALIHNVLVISAYVCYNVLIMETHTLPRPAEAQPIPDELAFADVLAIQRLRDEQLSEISTARATALDELLKPDSDGKIPHDAWTKGSDVMTEAETRVKATFDDQCKTYLDTHMNRDDNPETYDRLLGLLKATSVHNMDIKTWHDGEKDDDGNYTKPETSGQALVKQTLVEIANETVPDTDTELEDTPEMVEMRGKVSEARNKLAKLSTQLRGTVSKRRSKNKKLQAEYDELDKEYHELFTQLTLAEMQQMRAAGKTDQEMLARGTTKLLDEHQAFSLAEKAILEAGDTRKSRFINWFADHKWGTRGATAGTGVAIGLGASIAKRGVHGLLAFSGAVALPAAIGAAVAVKSTRALWATAIGNQVDQRVRFDERHEQDRAALDRASHKFVVTDDHDEEAMAKMHSNALRNVIGERVKTDRKNNFKRTLAITAIGAVAGAATYGMYEAVEHTNGFGIWSPHDQTPPGPSADGNPPVVEQNPSGGGGSGDVNGGAGSGGVEGHAGGGVANAAHTETLGSPNVVDGYDTNVVVENGHGYQRELIELLQEKNQHLSSENSWKLYLHLQDKFPDGNFFTNIGSYKMDDGYFGINSPGSATWNPAVIHEINRWMAEHASEVSTS